MKENPEVKVNKKGFAFCLMGTRQKFLDQKLEWHTGLKESVEIFHPKEAVYAVIAHFQSLKRNKVSSEPTPTCVFGVFRNGDTLQFPGDKLSYDDFVKLMRKEK